jgi:hypothetical protein
MAAGTWKSFQINAIENWVLKICYWLLKSIASRWDYAPDESRIQRCEPFLDDLPRPLAWAGMIDAVGVWNPIPHLQKRVASDQNDLRIGRKRRRTNRCAR